MPQKELQILDKAIEAIQHETGFVIERIAEEVAMEDKTIADARIRLRTSDIANEFLVEVKPNVTETTIGHLAHMFGADSDKWLFVTRYVNPEMGRRLRDLHIQFMDTVGNAYIEKRPTFVFIRGNKPEPLLVFAPQEGMLSRAGLKLIFTFLCKPDFWNMNYRNMANAANVALGTVVGVLKDLTARGYMVEFQKDQRRLVRRKELLDEWVRAYAQKLRPKTLLGRYTAPRPDFWQQAELAHLNAQWGGEIGAYKLTRYLKAEIVTIYGRRPLNDVILDLRLRKDNKGDIELREKFWNFETMDPDKTTVPPLLVYADLFATGDARNVETAIMIYEQYLQRYIEQD